jgi:hypothetical protein
MDKRHTASELFAISQHATPEEIEKALSLLEPHLLSAAQNGCTSLTVSPLHDLMVTDEFAEQHLAAPLRGRGFVVRNHHFGLNISWAQASMADVLEEVRIRG